jgi:hypothetical protein
MYLTSFYPISWPCLSIPPFAIITLDTQKTREKGNTNRHKQTKNGSNNLTEREEGALHNNISGACLPVWLRELFVTGRQRKKDLCARVEGAEGVGSIASDRLWCVCTHTHTRTSTVIFSSRWGTLTSDTPWDPQKTVSTCILTGENQSVDSPSERERIT